MAKDNTTPIAAADTVPAPEQAVLVTSTDQLPSVLEEPHAGGRYLRDPATGALTPNPG